MKAVAAQKARVGAELGPNLHRMGGISRATFRLIVTL